MVTQRRIAITGGAGFIGSHLVERLAPEHSLVLFDNHRRDALGDLDLDAMPDVTLRTGDVLDPAAVGEAVADADVVIHLAAIAGVSTYYAEPLRTLRVNILGTANVLEAAGAAGVEQFLYFSTSEVYGPHAKDVGEDDLLCIGPPSDRRWVYATSKLAGENLTLATGAEHGFRATCLRPFNVYGPRQQGEGAISNFMRAAVAGEPLTVYGNGTATRSWCFVSDLVDAVEAVLTAEATAGRSFNIGNPDAVETSAGLAHRVAALVPGSAVRFEPTDRTEVVDRSPNIDQARNCFGFEPKTDLDSGLRQTLAWFRESAA